MPIWNGRQLQRRMTDPLKTLSPTPTLPYANSPAPRAHTNTSLMPWSSHLSSTSTPSPTRRWHIPSLRRIEQSVRRVVRRRQSLLTCLFILGMGLSCLLLVRHIHRRGDKYTLVFERENLQQIWRCVIPGPQILVRSLTLACQMGGRERTPP